MVDILQCVALILYGIVLLSLNKRIYHLALDVIDLKFPKKEGE